MERQRSTATSHSGGRCPPDYWICTLSLVCEQMEHLPNTATACWERAVRLASTAQAGSIRTKCANSQSAEAHTRQAKGPLSWNTIKSMRMPRPLFSRKCILGLTCRGLCFAAVTLELCL